MKTNVSNLKVFAFLLLVSMSTSILCSCGSKDDEEIDLQGIKECRDLEVAKFNFHKIEVVRKTVKIVSLLGHGVDGPERVLILPINMEVVGKIDFSNVTKDNVSTDEEGLTFILPDPTLKLHSDVDDETQEKTSKEQWYRGGEFSDQEITAIAKQAKGYVMTEKTLRMMAERTRENAASIIIPLLSDATGLPKESIKVQFCSDLNLSSAEIKDNNTIIYKRKE